MQTFRGKSLVWTLVVTGLVVIAVSVIALKQPALEWWYLSTIEAGDECEAERAADRLASMGSAAVVPDLAGLARQYLDGLPSNYDEMRKAIEWEARDPDLRIPGVAGGAYPVFVLPLQALIGLGESAAPALVEFIRIEDLSYKFFGFYALIKMGPPSLPPVSVLADDPDDEVRALFGRFGEIIAEVHGGSECKAAVPLLEEALCDESEEVRKRAAQALGKYGESGLRAVPALIERAEDDRGDSVQFCATRSLGRIGPVAKQALPALEKIVAGEDQGLSGAAQEAIDKIRGRLPSGPK